MTRRFRIEYVNSSIKRCRLVKDGFRLWKHGIRDRVMELCCALHNFRVRRGFGTNDLIKVNSFIETSIQKLIVNQYHRLSCSLIKRMWPAVHACIGAAFCA